MILHTLFYVSLMGLTEAANPNELLWRLNGAIDDSSTRDDAPQSSLDRRLTQRGLDILLSCTFFVLLAGPTAVACNHLTAAWMTPTQPARRSLVILLGGALALGAAGAASLAVLTLLRDSMHFALRDLVSTQTWRVRVQGCSTFLSKGALGARIQSFCTNRQIYKMEPVQHPRDSSTSTAFMQCKPNLVNLSGGQRTDTSSRSSLSQSPQLLAHVVLAEDEPVST